MNLRQAAQQALEMLEWNYNADLDNIPACEQWAKTLKETITALKQALAEPEQEPTPGYCKHCKQYTIEEPLPAKPQTTHWEGCEAVHPECRKPEQEPVAWMLITPYGEEDDIVYTEPEIVPDGWSYKPLYDTAPTPRQWVSLTEQEMYDLFFHDQYGPRLPEYLVNTIKCIEAALKEKNSGS